MIYKRDLTHQIEPYLKRKEFISITGPRQSGKTTFLSILRNHLVDKMGVKGEEIQTITFEDRKLLAQFTAEPVTFVKSYTQGKNSSRFYLMMDEYQYVEDGGQKLKLIYDTIDNLKIIITGSSSLETKANVAKYMVGRLLTFNLYPFNFGEFLSVKDQRLATIYREYSDSLRSWIFNEQTLELGNKIDIFKNQMISLYEEYCIWGGYPAVVTEDNIEMRKKLLESIYNNYIIKDIKTLLELATERNLFRLSQYLATQVGNIVIYKNLSNISDLEYRKLKAHLSILKETFICKEVTPFFKNRQKELSKNPKVFFLDAGFRNNLMENFNSLDKRSDSGALIENAVFIRLDQLKRQSNKINFWRTKAGAEVDFVLHTGSNIIPVEVKYSAFTREQVSRSLVSFLREFNPRHAVVLTKDFWGTKVYENTHVGFFPVYYL